MKNSIQILKVAFEDLRDDFGLSDQQKSVLTYCIHMIDIITPKYNKEVGAISFKSGACFESEPGYILIDKQKPHHEEICDFITDDYTYHTGMYISQEDLFLLPKNGDFYHSISVIGWKKSYAKIEFQ